MPGTRGAVGCKTEVVHDVRTTVAEKIEQQAHALREELVQIRRDIHMHPETARQEHRTTERICQILGQSDLQPRVLPTAQLNRLSLAVNHTLDLPRQVMPVQVVRWVVMLSREARKWVASS